MPVLDHEVQLTDRGQRRFLSSEFMNILRAEPRYKNFGPTLQSFAMELVLYAFKYGAIAYSRKKFIPTKDKKKGSDILKFKKEIRVADEVFSLEYSVEEEKLQRGYL